MIPNQKLYDNMHDQHKLFGGERRERKMRLGIYRLKDAEEEKQ